ncbi:3-isopropylmalate dehydratase small subunit [Pseudomonas helleri]|uniref:3-isopropylmalate dehydratase small subunit n=1 Tax=Pseudomonas helleri TaxID=1608996 RepID=A0A6L5HXP1_9PSED|nr:3-isopropylmalate dehydratase small subunit [Pseudomonas helleri]MQU08154.1 3-isopropylmalate dehydratase small subunit [Pseudomonas helleri]
MQKFTTLDSIVVPLDRRDVDTDAIIPKQFMKSIRRTGFGQHLFDNWRYLNEGQLGEDCSTRPLNTNFALNQPQFQGAKILLCRDNFGCGSSREHAVWALKGYGIRALVGTTFADIFENNCLNNGLLPVKLSPEVIEDLFIRIAQNHHLRLSIDLHDQTLSHDATIWSFEIDPNSRKRLLFGLDSIGETLKNSSKIRAYEARESEITPWLYTEKYSASSKNDPKSS